VLLATIACVLVAVQVEQRILRWRAERLLSEITALRLRQSDWQAAQKIRERWGSWGRYDGSCTSEHCYYEIELKDFGYRHANLFANRPWAWNLYQRIGGRPARIRADWEVDAGRVWAKGFGVHVEVPPAAGHDFGYTLIATSDSVSRFPFYTYWPQLLLHPNYIIGTPGGCESCLAVYAKFTPYTDPSEIDRLMRFNLSCLTRWDPCRERGDIMSVAWNQYVAEMPRWQASRQRIMGCQTYPLEWLGRDSENAALVEIESTKPGREAREPSRTIEVKLLQRLKGLDKWPTGNLQFQLDQQMLYRAVEQGSENIAPGRRFVFLLHDWSRWPKPDFRVEPCGAIAATRSNVDAIERGIRLDYRTEMVKSKQASGSASVTVD